jgi:hypothetical protein
VAQAAITERLEGRLRALRAQDRDCGEDAGALASAHAAAAKVVAILLTSLRSTPRSRVMLRAADLQTPKVPLTRPWERKPIA